MKFKVTITEMLKLTACVETNSSEEAEQMVNDAWYKGEYVLDADNFVGVEFEAAPVYEQEDSDNGS